MIERSSDIRSALRSRQRGMLLNPFRFGGSGDPLYANRQLILHGEGTNGGSVFTDNSQNATTLTRTGAVVTSTSQFRAGASSISVPATTGMKLQTPNSAIYRGASSIWTVECSVYATAWTGTRVVYDGNSDGTNNTGPIMYVDTGLLYVYSGAQATTYGGTGSALPTSTWCDLMWSWDGTSLRFAVNGTIVSTTTGFTNLWGTSGCSLFGNKTATPAQCLNGFADEFRFTKGAAITANYTPVFPFPNS